MDFIRHDAKPRCANTLVCAIDECALVCRAGTLGSRTRRGNTPGWIWPVRRTAILLGILKRFCTSGRLSLIWPRFITIQTLWVQDSHVHTRRIFQTRFSGLNGCIRLDQFCYCLSFVGTRAGYSRSTRRDCMIGSDMIQLFCFFQRPSNSCADPCHWCIAVLDRLLICFFHRSSSICLTRPVF